eukprot:COSAG01_NODE_58672_length_304_cov_1.619512_1_plen_86_part_10
MRVCVRVLVVSVRMLCVCVRVRQQMRVCARRRRLWHRRTAQAPPPERGSGTHQPACASHSPSARLYDPHTRTRYSITSTTTLLRKK